MGNEVIPESLRRRYVESFHAKGAALEGAVDDLRADVPDAAQALRLLAHKLSGSAGMYGFEDLGQLAREVVHAIDAGASRAIVCGLSGDLAARLAGARAAQEI